MPANHSDTQNTYISYISKNGKFGQPYVVHTTLVENTDDTLHAYDILNCMQVKSLVEELNIREQCRRYKVTLWTCPHFLFIVMGIIIIFSILITNLTAQRYADPEISALIVLVVTMILLVISHIIVQSFERMAEAIKVKAEFISIASHQLRSPLTSIKWELELLLKDESVQNKARSYLEDITEYNKRMIKLVNDFLAVNRIESSKLLLAPLPASLVEITQKAIKDFDIFAKASNIILALEPQTPQTSIPPAFVDETHIRWAMDNLINNAIRYSNPKSTIVISIRKKNGPYIIWSITNQGDFISSTDAKQIFQKFFRSPQAIKQSTEGSGLGLYIAKAVVEASGGSMDFTSDVHGNNTFWFTVPIAKQ